MLRPVKEKEPKLIYIEWQDACGESGWKSGEEMKDWLADEEGVIVQQCGWLLKETKHHIDLASRKSPTGKWEVQYGQFQKIPKTWIKKRITLSQVAWSKNNKKKK